MRIREFVLTNDFVHAPLFLFLTISQHMAIVFVVDVDILNNSK